MIPLFDKPIKSKKSRADSQARRAVQEVVAKARRVEKRRARKGYEFNVMAYIKKELR